MFRLSLGGAAPGVGARRSWFKLIARYLAGLLTIINTTTITNLIIIVVYNYNSYSFATFVNRFSDVRNRFYDVKYPLIISRTTVSDQYLFLPLE